MQSPQNNSESTPKVEQLLQCVIMYIWQLSYRWKIYCQLFDSGQENLELLNASGSGVFALLQRLILDDMILSLSKLTDSGKNRESLQMLLRKAKPYLEGIRYQELDEQLKRINGKMGVIRDHRNKEIAHEQQKGTYTLHPLSYDELEEMVANIQSFTKLLAKEACQMTISHFDVIIPFGTGGDHLLKVLKRKALNG